MFFKCNRGSILGLQNLPSFTKLGDSSSQVVSAKGVGESMLCHAARLKSLNVKGHLAAVCCKKVAVKANSSREQANLIDKELSKEESEQPYTLYQINKSILVGVTINGSQDGTRYWRSMSLVSVETYWQF